MHDERRAMDGALKLLEFRGRSRKELAVYLKAKKFSDDIIEKTVLRLGELGLANDEKLARQWVEGGLERGWGRQKIRQFLFKRGIDKSVIDQEVNRPRPNDDEAAKTGTEDERAWLALTKRAERLLKQPLSRDAVYRRLISYLQRQGFELDAAKGALQKFFRENPRLGKENDGEHGIEDS